MHCTLVSEDASSISLHLAELGIDRKANVKTPGPDKDSDTDIYGADLKISVSTPANALNLRSVEISFGISCGYDSMLLLYENSSSGWRPVLRWQRDDYDQASGAFGDFFLFQIIPARESGRWRVIAAHGYPWCTSRWSGFEMDLLEPSEDFSHPKVVWHTSHGYVREDTPRLTTTADGFDLRLEIGTIEANVMTRKGVFRYRVSGDTVERIQPIATNGRGFIDEWLQEPWNSAKQWVAPDILSVAEKNHAAFQKTRSDIKSNVGYEYGPVRSCRTSNLYQVEIDRDPTGPLYYTVRSGKNSFTLIGIGEKPNPQCNGPDLMKTSMP